MTSHKASSSPLMFPPSSRTHGSCQTTICWRFWKLTVVSEVCDFFFFFSQKCQRVIPPSVSPFQKEREKKKEEKKKEKDADKHTNTKVQAFSQRQRPKAKAGRSGEANNSDNFYLFYNKKNRHFRKTNS